MRLNLSSIREDRVQKKRQRCDCPDGECGLCMHGWYFTPYYGKGDGQSPAAISTGPGSVGMTGMDVPSGAFPGAGGINSPSVPGGANAGMGPITMSKAMGRSLFLEVYEDNEAKQLVDYIAWIEDLKRMGDQAVQELKSKKIPQLKAAQFVGTINGMRSEAWFKFFYS